MTLIAFKRWTNIINLSSRAPTGLGTLIIRRIVICYMKTSAHFNDVSYAGLLGAALTCKEFIKT